MWNFLLDCVTISINGLSIDTMLSKLHDSRISVRNLSRKSRTQLRITIPQKDYDRFSKIANSLSMKYTVTHRKGVLYSTHNAIARPLLLIGSIVVILAAILANSFAMRVEYDITADEHTRDEIVSYCTQMGIYRGAYMRGWDIDDIELSIYLDIDNIAFVSIGQRGSTVSIEVIEETQSDIDRDRGDLANIIARKSCVLHEIIVYNGNCLVEVGDVVSRGQLLVSSSTPIQQDTSIVNTGADAKITGRIWYTHSVDEPLYDMIYTPNGREQKTLAIIVGERTIFQSKKKLDVFESETYRYMPLASIIPIEIVVEQQYGQDMVLVEIDEATAVYRAEANALSGARELLPLDADIRNTTVNSYIIDDIITAQVTIETYEIISQRILLENKE